MKRKGGKELRWAKRKKNEKWRLGKQEKTEQEWWKRVSGGRGTRGGKRDSESGVERKNRGRKTEKERLMKQD